MSNKQQPFFGDEVEDVHVDSSNNPAGQDDNNVDASEQLENKNILTLPSNGALGYPSQVYFRDIMAGDEEILASATGDTYSKTLNGVLKSILNDCEFFEKMSVADRDYCLIWLWSNNYQPNKTSHIQCPHCEHEFKKEFDMLDLPYSEVSEKYTTNFSIDVKKTGGKMFVRLSTVGDEMKAEEFVRTQKKKKIKETEQIPYDRVMLYLSITIDGAENLSVEQKAKWIAKNVSAKELGYVKQFHKYFHYGVDTVVDVVCPSCEGEAKARIPFQTEDVLYPELQSDFEDLL